MRGQKRKVSADIVKIERAVLIGECPPQPEEGQVFANDVSEQDLKEYVKRYSRAEVIHVHRGGTSFDIETTIYPYQKIVFSKRHGMSWSISSIKKMPIPVKKANTFLRNMKLLIDSVKEQLFVDAFKYSVNMTQYSGIAFEEVHDPNWKEQADDTFEWSYQFAIFRYQEGFLKFIDDEDLQRRLIQLPLGGPLPEHYMPIARFDEAALEIFVKTRLPHYTTAQLEKFKAASFLNLDYHFYFMNVKFAAVYNDQSSGSSIEDTSASRTRVRDSVNGLRTPSSDAIVDGLMSSYLTGDAWTPSTDSSVTLNASNSDSASGGRTPSSASLYTCDESQFIVIETSGNVVTIETTVGDDELNIDECFEYFKN